MRPVKWLFPLLAAILVLALTASAEIQFRGYSLTDWYSFQSRDSTHHQQFYETVSLRLERPGVNTLALVTHLRWQGDTADSFDSSSVLRVHNLYLRFAHKDMLDFRVGRQFLAEGVGFGTFDALRLNLACPHEGVGLTLWDGITAPDSRKGKVQQWRDDKAFGGALRYRMHEHLSLLGSYLYQEREGLKFRHRAGISANVGLSRNLTGTALGYFNLSSAEAIHRIRAFLRYTGLSRYRFSLEWAMGTPELIPDTPFEAIEIETFQLARLTGAYQVSKNYWVGLRASSLLSAKRPNTTLGLSLEGPWGTLGYRQRFGTFGDESGLFGSALYRATSYAQIYGAADYSRYKFEDWTDREDQAEGQAGVRLFPVKPLMIDASIQALKNTQFKSDVRGLLRVKWSFSN